MVTAYDPFDPQFLADPYPAYRMLRDEDPVHHHVGARNGIPPFWALSRFEDVWNAVRDTDTYSSAQGLTFVPDEIGKLGLAPTIVMLDPPRHGQLRGLVAKGFTPRRVAALEDSVRGFVRALLDSFADRREVDLHREFSSPVPTFVLAELLGVPAADRTRFDPWVAALTALQDSGFDLNAMSAPDAVAEMFEYFAGLITERRRAPGDDLISALTEVESDGELLTDWEILGFCFVLVAGGNDTTGNLISHAVMLLDADHRQRALVVDEPARIPGAIVETLRLEGSVQGLARTTTRDVELHGVTIPAGEKVMMLYGAANRDEREFGDTAEQFDITRSIPRHLGFASGPHFCIGSHLAKLQSRVALEELLARYPHMSVDPGSGVRLQSSFTRGWVSLPALLHQPTGR
ncbi:cytochrome P450 [Rhodococcus rhodochrous KG-21]|uniref:Cytochrome P450 n=1 Tax=Rhodococcus rhodochrous KG-21 TaxID=1441923 RepID=A0A0M8PR16_RHORH|nr:cytochrome P450 [Rhodococcus rhodochrous KG-21]